MVSSIHGPPKNRDSKAPTISDPTHWVSFAEQFKAFAKNYGDAEKIISDETDINYVHNALSQPYDLPPAILLSYSQSAIAKVLQLFKKETTSTSAGESDVPITCSSSKKQSKSALSNLT